MKVRDLIRHMKDHGCVALRQSGSHEMYRLPNGQTFPIVVNHKNDEVSLVVMSSARRAFKAAGIPL
jgi:predicted RNA binding protein YcfA (HicA-like mRNA interferase family)